MNKFEKILNLGKSGTEDMKKQSAYESLMESLGASQKTTDFVGNNLLTNTDKSDMQDISDIASLFGGGL